VFIAAMWLEERRGKKGEADEEEPAPGAEQGAG